MAFSFELNAVNLRYKDVDVLSNISLSINAGEHVALLGKSGAGKSTLLNTLYQQQRAHCALVPQNVALVEALSVFHNVYMGRLNQYNTFYNLLNLLWPQHDPVAEVGQLVESLGLDDMLFSATGELSGGQKQRVAIARALYQNNQVLLGDEPISALDTTQARKIMQLLHNEHDTVVLAMHDVAMALCFADRVVGIKNGSIAIDQPADAVSVADLQFLYES
jgi:phosphonate transport system ATP-binding protein